MFRHASAIGADIGHNTLRIAVVKMEGDILASNTYPLNELKSRDSLINTLLTAIRDIRKAVASEGVNPICTGISVKGFIDHQNGVVLGPDQGIEGWTNVPLARIVYQETGLPVYIGNDANMMTIAEHRFGAGKGFNDIIFIALRTGIGGGIIINGKLYRGVNNAGGEVGQMVIHYDGEISDKGISGSWEHYASASALIRRYNEHLENSLREAKLSCREIFELSYNNSPVAVSVVEENARIVGIGIANLIAIFAPEKIIIGGGMSEARESYFNIIVKSAIDNSLENCRAGVRIEKALLGPSASLLGVSYYALTRLAGKSV
ncbi:MAG TPA: ROK family protein [Bacteroidales bacterium]|nr:ROK family protein [Bacteroidales bacterium]